MSGLPRDRGDRRHAIALLIRGLFRGSTPIVMQLPYRGVVA